ncbi:MAG: NADH dehydrogenase [Firmicutes bacterium]|nr:NADH dehydrogenase [Bacillota bacterium]
MFLVFLVTIPILGVPIWYFKRDSSINIPFMASAALLLLGLLGFKDVFTGSALVYKMALSGPFSPSFRIDALSAVFVLLASFLWLVVAIYAPEYMQHEGKTAGFELCTLLTFSAVLGVFMAGDLITMLLFFELMTIASYFWVVHRWNGEAVKAGYFYLFFSIIGGLFLALGIVFLGSSGQPLTLGSGAVGAFEQPLSIWGIVLLIAGFGIKAGMVPLHLWLPHAHSVAPTPASALLSGLIIKIGAYGLIRVGEFVGWGAQLSGGTAFLGPGLISAGVLTMLLGVTGALLQSDAKRLLAYHSVSQMGYIILGLGAGLYLGTQGSYGLVGAVYHIVNHALFKATLFLGVGVIYTATKETDLYKLGGLLRKFPVTAVLMFFAVMGITGTPGLNGYASKTILHHAVSQAALAGTPLVVWAERLFMLVGVGTTASFAKLYYLMFLGQPTKLEVSGGETKQFQAAMSLLVAIMVLIGLRPGLFVRIAALPLAEGLGLANAGPALKGLNFWAVPDLVGMAVTLALGVAFCWVGLKSGLFHWQPPRFLTLEGLGMLIYQGFSSLFRNLSLIYRNTAVALKRRARVVRGRFLTLSEKMENPEAITFGNMSFSDISANTGLLMAVLVVLILVYTYKDLGHYVKLPIPLAKWIGK